MTKRLSVLTKLQRRKMLELVHGGSSVDKALRMSGSDPAALHKTLTTDPDYEAEFRAAQAFAIEMKLYDRAVGRSTAGSPASALLGWLYNKAGWLTPSARAAIARESASRTAGGSSGPAIKRLSFGQNPFTKKFEYSLPREGTDHLLTGTQMIQTDKSLPALEPWPGTPGVAVADEVAQPASAPALDERPEAPDES